MKVSIIIPVYNVSQYIIACLNSISSQDYHAIECILIDDNSTDNSSEIIKNWIADYNGEKTFFLHSSNLNQGASAARNKGILFASGDYIFFLDSDDTLPLKSISALVQINHQYNNIDLVQGELICENASLFNDLSLLQKNIPSYSNNKELIKRIIFTEFPVSPCNKLIRLSIIKENQLFFKEGIVNEDVLWLFSLRLHISSIATCITPTYFYRYNPTSVMTSKDNEKNRILSYMKILKILIDQIDPSIKFWDNYAILRQFEHNKFNTIENEENKSLFDYEFKKCIEHALKSKNVLFYYKPLFSWLNTTAIRSKSSHAMFKKCLGLLYRFGSQFSK